MAKRFTDTEKWKKPFLRSMKAPYKLLWLYILDECDHAGVWQVDFEVAQIKIGEKIKVDDAENYLEGRYISFDRGEKWFIPDFIDFQYGKLNPENRAHNSVIQILSKHSLIDLDFKPLTSPLQGAKDKDMDKEKELVKEMDKDKDRVKTEITLPFSSENFIKVWNVLIKEKKWKGKSESALVASAHILSKHDEKTAIQMMLNTIAGEWQGLFELKEGAGQANKADFQARKAEVMNRILNNDYEQSVN